MSNLGNYEIDERGGTGDDLIDTITVRRTMSVAIDKDLVDTLEVEMVIRLAPLFEDLISKAISTATAHSKLHDGDIDLGIILTPTMRAIRAHRKAVTSWSRARQAISYEARRQARLTDPQGSYYSAAADAAEAAAVEAWEAEHPRPVFTPSTKGR